jgi:hypothetical protein
MWLLIEQNNQNITYKGYDSLGRLCREIGISKLDSKSTPAKIGKYTILKIEVESRI